MGIFEQGMGPREYAFIHIVSHKRSGATPDGNVQTDPDLSLIRPLRSVARQAAPGCAMISEPSTSPRR
jgi:hypothetical protein